MGNSWRGPLPFAHWDSSCFSGTLSKMEFSTPRHLQTEEECVCSSRRPYPALGVGLPGTSQPAVCRFQVLPTLPCQTPCSPDPCVLSCVVTHIHLISHSSYRKCPHCQDHSTMQMGSRDSRSVTREHQRVLRVRRLHGPAPGGNRSPETSEPSRKQIHLFRPT